MFIVILNAYVITPCYYTDCKKFTFSQFHKLSLRLSFTRTRASSHAPHSFTHKHNHVNITHAQLIFFNPTIMVFVATPQAGFEPDLPDMDELDVEEVEEEEESVKIVRLVKRDEPLGATIKADNGNLCSWFYTEGFLF